MPVYSSRGGSFSGGSAGFRSTGRNSKIIKNAAALSHGFPTINEYLDSLGKNDLCKNLAVLHQECISDYSRCDNYYKRLSSCPDFEEGKYLQSKEVKDYLRSNDEYLQKLAAANGFSTIDEYSDDRDRRDPNTCRDYSLYYKEECTSQHGTSTRSCDYLRKRMALFSCPGFKKGTTGSMEKNS